MELNVDCPCKRIKCEYHGNCEACRKHHLIDTRHPTYCDRLKEKEKKKLEKNKSKEKKRS